MNRDLSSSNGSFSDSQLGISVYYRWNDFLISNLKMNKNRGKSEFRLTHLKPEKTPGFQYLIFS